MRLVTRQKKQTYIKCLNNNKEAVLAETGVPWSPGHVTLDNEVGAMIAVVEVLGIIPVTCYFHVQQNMIKNYAKPYGFEIDKDSYYW